jgi:plasmid maintenance system killer protein
MEIIFNSNKLKKICNDINLLQRRFGNNRAKKIGQRLFDINAANTLTELSTIPPIRCHELKGDLKGQLAVNVDEKLRIVFIPENQPIPRKKDGGLDWSRVIAIRIMTIEDYHE